MSDINEKVINHYLGSRISSEQDIVQDKQGLVGLFTNLFYSGMTGLTLFANVIVLLFTGLLVWTGFRFFTSTMVEDYTFWGICLLLTLQVQVALKQWLWSQIDKNAILRELKRTQRLILANKSTD